MPVCRVSPRWLDISHLMVLLDVCMCMSQSQIYRQWVGPGPYACLQGGHQTVLAEMPALQPSASRLHEQHAVLPNKPLIWWLGQVHWDGGPSQPATLAS